MKNIRGYHYCKSVLLTLFAFFIGFAAQAQVPGVIPFHTTLKNSGNGEPVSRVTPILIKAQYLGYDNVNSRWCVISEEGFSSTVINGVLPLRLGAGTVLATAGVTVSGFTSVVPEFLTQDSSVSDVFSMMNLSQITWDTHCHTNISSATGWVAETTNVSINAWRALRLNIDLGSGVILRL